VSRRRTQERGAVAIVVAIVAVLILGAAAFTVDLGMQRVVRTDMQSTADTASLDMARALANGAVPGTAAWTQALRVSISNDSATLGHANALPAGWDPSTAVCNAKLCAQATPGYLDLDSQFVLTAPTGATSYNAVRVTATAAVGRGLASVFGSGDLAAARAAVAATRSSACFKVGSYAAGLRTGNGALAPLLALLGADATLTALGSDGIATTNVTAAQFLDAVGTAGGTVAGVSGSATLKQILTAEADLLPSSSQASTDLHTIIDGGAPILGRTVDLAKVVDLAAGGPAALGANLNLGDVLGGSVAVANGANSIALDGFSADLGLASVSGGLRVTQPAQLACGPKGTTASTADVSAGPLTIGFTPDVLTSLAGGLGSALTIAGLNVGIDSTSLGTTTLAADLASATGQLTDVRCDPDGIDVTVTHNSLLSTTLATTVTVAARVSILGLGLVNLALPYHVTVHAEADSATPAPIAIDLSDPANYDKPYDDPSAGTLGLGSPVVALDPSWTARVAGVDVKGLLPGALVSGLLGTTGGLVPTLTSSITASVDAAVEQGVLAPLGQLLGLTIPGAQVYAELPKPDCGNPRLTH